MIKSWLTYYKCCILYVRVNELHDQLAGIQDQLQQVSSDLTNLHGERSDKYKELKKREESMRGIILMKIVQCMHGILCV